MASLSVLVDALKAAIDAGAALVPPSGHFSPDVNYVRSQTEVAIDDQTLEVCVSTLRTDPELLAIGEMFASGPYGGGFSIGLHRLAKALLAQCLHAGDIRATAQRFLDAVARNRIPAVAVWAVMGFSVTRPVQLGADVRLVPISQVPPSWQRSKAAGQEPLPGAVAPVPVPYAIVTKFTFGPVLYPLNEPQRAVEAQRAVNAANLLLEEAVHLLGVLGIYPVPMLGWIQPDDWLMSFGAVGASLVDRQPSGAFVPTAALSPDEAEALAGAYFAIPPEKRAKMLRIPLDRLTRSVRERDLADRAIDLGIALESLLLHDIDDRSELTFRLRLRGAALLGHTLAERRQHSRILRDAYQLRSRAAHGGFLEGTAEQLTTIGAATDVCKRLIREVIARGCNIDWSSLDVGDSGQPAA